MSTSRSRPITACQICGGGNLESVLFVGYIPPVNQMPPVGRPAEEQPAYPLEMLRCPDCTLVQIGLEVDKEVLFPPEYPYLSGSTRILRENFADLFRESQELLDLAGQDLIVDVGSNDGTLLGNFSEGGLPVLGIEPTRAALVANKRGVQTWMKFFTDEVAREVRAEFGGARLVTAANVFAHIADVHGVVEAILELLGPQGVFVSESHYLLSLVETVQYDTLYHEHLRYYSLRSLQRLLADHGLEVFHAKRIPTHGGSVRVYAARRGEQEIHDSVATLESIEDESGLTDGSLLRTFRTRVERSKLGLMGLLEPIKAKGERVYGVGAPSRASTLINYVGLDDGLIDCVMEISTSAKLDKFVPGTRIPVLDERKLFEDQPEYALMLSWHIQDELAPILRKKGFRGKFLSPLPEPRVLEL